MSAPLLPTRHSIEAQLMARGARRGAPRNPSWFELIAGLLSFVFVAAGCLFAVAWLGS